MKCEGGEGQERRERMSCIYDEVRLLNYSESAPKVEDVEVDGWMGMEVEGYMVQRRVTMPARCDTLCHCRSYHTCKGSHPAQQPH